MQENPGFDPWVGKIHWKRKWQPTPVLLPGKSRGQRSLVGYSPWGRKESDATEATEHRRGTHMAVALASASPVIWDCKPPCSSVLNVLMGNMKMN